METKGPRTVGVRACGTCGARYGEEPDAFQIERHTERSSIDDRAKAAVESSPSLSITELSELAESASCPALRAVMCSAVQLLAEYTTSRSVA